MLLELSRGICSNRKELQEWYSSYVSNHIDRLALDLEVIHQNVNQGEKVIEYGAIPLLLSVALKKRGYDICGLDISPERFSSSIEKFNLDVRKCDVEREKIPFPDSSFDVVIFNELFEHLRINPIFTMNEVRRILKPNGRLILSTPNLRSLYGIRNFLFRNLCYSCSPGIYSQYEKLEKLGHMGHVREYTTNEICEFLAEVGFYVDKMIFRGRYDNNLGQLVIRLMPKYRPFVLYIASKR
jgi:SAM-dependent methyltransferase